MDLEGLHETTMTHTTTETVSETNSFTISQTIMRTRRAALAHMSGGAVDFTDVVTGTIYEGIGRGYLSDYRLAAFVCDPAGGHDLELLEVIHFAIDARNILDCDRGRVAPRVSAHEMLAGAVGRAAEAFNYETRRRLRLGMKLGVVDLYTIRDGVLSEPHALQEAMQALQIGRYPGRVTERTREAPIEVTHPDAASNCRVYLGLG